jgi:Transcriptional regulator
MEKQRAASERRREAILNAAISIFSRYGFKKTSLEDIADAAGISKQGLYLYFKGKEDIFRAANEKYLRDGLRYMENELERNDISLQEKIYNAIDAWFGRHLLTFQPSSLDVLDARNDLPGMTNDIAIYKNVICAKIAAVLEGSPEFSQLRNARTPAEIADVLFMCGLSWKDAEGSHEKFMEDMAICIKVCCQFQE